MACQLPKFWPGGALARSETSRSQDPTSLQPLSGGSSHDAPPVSFDHVLHRRPSFFTEPSRHVQLNTRRQKGYDMVKWCNARSQMQGLTACYYTDARLTTIYRTGQAAPYVSWNANGYQLPAEAEWEKAARGGASGHRFPWSDTDDITHSRANYYVYQQNGTNAYACDRSPTAGWHPMFYHEGWPNTSPVGYSAPNGYGLYDMAGNGCEWCWDWYSDTYYSSSPTTAPRGPSSGAYRVLRSAVWNWLDANGACCANRFNFNPDCATSSHGFRCARRL